jgi:hypothetical protein
MNFKIQCDTRPLKAAMREIRKELIFTSIVLTVCNWFKKDKIFLSVNAALENKTIILNIEFKQNTP